MIGRCVSDFGNFIILNGRRVGKLLLQPFAKDRQHGRRAIDSGCDILIDGHLPQLAFIIEEKTFQAIKRIKRISKMWIRDQGKARGGEIAEHTRLYVSILSRSATQPWTLRRIFEMRF